MKKTAWCIPILLALICKPCFAKEIPLSAIEGRWGRGNCTWNFHSIELTKNGQFLRFVDELQTYYYYIAGTTERGHKLIMLSEDRFDEKENPVAWYVVFHNPNSYSWLRSDREADDLRGPITRCK